MVTEAPSNWLSLIIAEKRGQIDRIVPFAEQKSERDAIVGVIRLRPEGEPLLSKNNLPAVVWGALGVANKCEREAKARPDVMAASPEVQASWFVFDELGIPRG